jgi:hypothetical protein
MADTSRGGDARVLATLRSLAESCRASGERLRRAASANVATRLRRLLLSYASQRDEFAGELDEQLARLGGAGPDLERGLEAAGRESEQTDEGSDLRDQIDAGESALLTIYARALALALPAEPRFVAERQYMEIREAQEHLRSLEWSEQRRP